MKDDIFNKISPNEAFEILKQIAKTDKKIKTRIIELARDLLRNVDVEAVCDDVFGALDGIDVHELWDRAGSKTDGYTSPEDMAVKMFEEALEPFLQGLYRAAFNGFVFSQFKPLSMPLGAHHHPVKRSVRLWDKK